MRPESHGLRALVLAAAFLAGIVAAAIAQTPTVHEAPRLATLSGNVFFRLTGDGSHILVNHSPDGAAEALVMVPRDGATEQVWIQSPGRRIYNRIATSGDGKTVAFAYSPGSEVYVLTGAGSAPRSIANVGPDGDVRQLVLSADGTLAAFTASRFRDENGQLIRVRTNLYVAATDGSKLTKITSAPVLQKFISFALSGDGKTLAWVDDPKKGAWVAGIDGSNPKRLPAAPGGRAIQAVFSDATGSTFYYQTVGAAGVTLHEVECAKATVSPRHEAPHGFYAVSADGSRVYLCQAEAGALGKRAWWHVTGSGLVKVATVSWPRTLGTWAWSAGCGTMVWCDGAATGGATTYVWRTTQP